MSLSSLPKPSFNDKTPRPTSSEETEKNRAVSIYIGLTLLAGCLLRLLFLGHDNLWMDEINTLIVATNHGYPDVLSATPKTISEWVHQHLIWQPIHWPTLMDMLKKNVHLPLYYVLLNPWLGLFSDQNGLASEVTLRSFSVLWGTLSIIALVQFSKDLFPNTPKAWLTTAILSAFNPLLIYYAQEGRMYSLVLFLSIISLWQLWQLTCSTQAHTSEKTTKTTALYVLTTGLALLTHYIFWFQLPLHACLWVWGLWQKRGPILKPLIISAFILGGILAWTIPMVFAQKSHLFATEKHFSAGLLHWSRYATALIWQPLMVFSGSGTWNKIIAITTMGFIGLYSLWGMIFNRLSALSTPSEEVVRPSSGNHSAVTTKAVNLFLTASLFIPLLFQIAVDIYMETHTVTIVRYTLLIAPTTILILSSLFSTSIHSHSSRALQAISFSMVCGFMILLGLGNVLPNSPIRPHKRFQVTPFAKEITQHLHITSNLTSNNTSGNGPNTSRPLIIANGTLASPCTLAYYLFKQEPEQKQGRKNHGNLLTQLPMLFYVNQYQGKPTYPLQKVLNTTTNNSNFKQVAVFNYRGGPHRGLTHIHDALTQQFGPPLQNNRIVAIYPTP